jgi:hypothetical protein
LELPVLVQKHEDGALLLFLAVDAIALDPHHVPRVDLVGIDVTQDKLRLVPATLLGDEARLDHVGARVGQFVGDSSLGDRLAVCGRQLAGVCSM